MGSSTFGIWGMIDASECVPTYNSCLYLFVYSSVYFISFIFVAYDDIRGFMANDYFRKNLNPAPANAFVSKNNVYILE